MGLAPHHDGSSLYVPNQAPKLLDKVKVRVRVHQALGKVKEVRVRFSESGEAFPTPPAKVIRRDGQWSWYESTIVMHNPKMNYRFMIVLESGETVWYNTQGLSLRNPADILDFRINTFSSAPKWGKDAVMYQIFPDRFARSSKADKHKTPDWGVPQKWGDPVLVEGRDRSQQFYGGDLWGVIEKLDHLKKLGIKKEKVIARVAALHEFNPMLGHRGCRLGIAYPEITETQARAIFEAAAAVQKKGIKVKPEVMVPLVGFKRELDLQVEVIHRVAAEVQKEQKVKIAYSVGTMIEVPRGALTADEIAHTAEFFSFGTNDLTQTALGVSRDDMGNFLNAYTENEIFKKNPFATLDQTGVGQLIQMAIEKGRKTRPDIKLGICGEHGGEPESVKFCHRVGLNYVSCSPYRVPVARLAAAQAAIEEKRTAKK